MGERMRVAERRLAAVLLVTSLLALTAGGCAPQSEESPLMSLRRDLPEDTTLLLPGAEPPDLIDAGLSSGNDTPIISFYSLNQPIVSICQAPVDTCHRLLPTSQVIPRTDVQPGVTVLIEAQEGGVQKALSEELRRFWSDVDLVAGRPAWLGDR
ncbi:MAG TPA: hypothetical protein VES19_04690 [Candidatus Limnocylindrales bacterium]|nr:hypothetical protein [Candidatus Limnocylindrales bacterium]